MRSVMSGTEEDQNEDDLRTGPELGSGQLNLWGLKEMPGNQWAQTKTWLRAENPGSMRCGKQYDK